MKAAGIARAQGLHAENKLVGEMEKRAPTTKGPRFPTGRASLDCCLSEGKSAPLKYDGARGNALVVHSLSQPFIYLDVVCCVRNCGNSRGRTTLTAAQWIASPGRTFSPRRRSNNESRLLDHGRRVLSLILVSHGRYQPILLFEDNTSTVRRCQRHHLPPRWPCGYHHGGLVVKASAS